MDLEKKSIFVKVTNRIKNVVFLLTLPVEFLNNPLERIKESRGRVVVLSSDTHGRGEINFRKDMVLVLSNRRSDTRWERPENIRIENCTIHGSVRLIGMGPNGEASDVGKSSRCEGPFDFDRDCRGHTRRAQEAAPTGIVLRNMRVIGVGRNPVYFATGATGNMLVDSEVTGVSDAVGVYLDAESARNIIRNNYIHVSTADRKSTPQLAVDGSAYNIIAGNRFSALNHGGIYLYRNWIVLPVKISH